MKTPVGTFLAGTAIVAMLAGCHPGSSIVKVWDGDPHLPDAATVFTKDNPEMIRAEREDAAADAAAADAAPAPAMTSAQESKAMPLPGQANDHSSKGLDGKKS